MREEDLELLLTLDDPWNAQECDTFYSQQAEQEAEEWKGTLQTVTAEIEKLAYRFWEERGRPFGSPEEDWFKAERELHHGLVGPPERLPFSSLSMGHVTS